MEEIKPNPDAIQDRPQLCNRFSHQIIGMTFGEEKQLMRRTPKEQMKEPKTSTIEERRPTATPDPSENAS